MLRRFTPHCVLLAGVLFSTPAASAAKPPVETRLETTRTLADLFVRMCMKGEAHLNNSTTTKIERKQLPGNIQGWYGKIQDGTYYRINEPKFEAFTVHYVDPVPKGNDYKEVCAIFAETLMPNEAAVQISKAMHIVFADDALPKADVEWTYYDLDHGFMISVRNVGTYGRTFVVMQSSILNDADKARRIKAREDDARRAKKKKS